MSFLRIDLGTTSKIFNQISSQFGLLEDGHQSFVDMLVNKLACTIFGIDRVLLGQVLVLQDRFNGDLEQILSVDDYPEDMGPECDHRLDIIQFRTIHAYPFQDLFLARLIAELYGKPLEQLVADISEMFNADYASVCGIKYPVLAEQYRELVIRVILIIVTLLIHGIALAALIASFSQQHNIPLPQMIEQIRTSQFDLEGVPEEQYEAFCELIYDPLMYYEEDQRKFRAWYKQIPDSKVFRHLMFHEYCNTLLDALLYHKYGPRSVAEVDTDTELAVRLDTTYSMATIEI